MSPDCLYEPAGDGVFVPTGLTRGPWDPNAQHGGPPAALLLHGVEAAAGVQPGQVVRLAYDILRPVPLAPLRLSVRTVRGGKRVELLEATLTGAEDETTLMRCTAWRVRAEAIAVPGVEPAGDPPPPPDDLAEMTDWGAWVDEVAYRHALDWRPWHGSFTEPGPCGVWSRLRVPLVAGHEATPLERMVVMADAASGFGAALPWEGWSFVNVELGIHLERPPQGEWMAMDARTHLGPAGAALAESVLHDRHGRCGRSTASLLLGRR